MRRGAGLVARYWPVTIGVWAVAVVLVAWLESSVAPEAFGSASTHLRDPRLEDVVSSDDGHTWLVTVDVVSHPYAPERRPGVRELREQLEHRPGPPGLDAYVTGISGVAVDEDEAIRTSVQRTQVLSVLLMFLLGRWNWWPSARAARD